MTMRYSDLLAVGPEVSEDPVRAADLVFLPFEAKPRRRGAYRNFFKRALDVVAVVLAGPIIVPIIFGLALGVRRDGGSAFYSQLRVGKEGRHFRMWKLRSMVTDADGRMADYLAANPQARAEWDATQKLKSDPRITRFGQFLRRSSLDELPQLWNVFVGEMSVVSYCQIWCLRLVGHAAIWSGVVASIP
ncbi:sugar transferase, partial [Pseudorhodobacter sp. W20_MBD10_FR17]|uniref:sugar transferase n=1 Tax=Pseudorhodobacter sp. W20_MBD10_FR17 TaxID=3240266 RepID=UPI003F984986